MRLHVGTSGYNFPEWKGTFYPEKIKAPEMLPYYAGRLSTVEINYTFYRMPNAKTVSGWSQAVPEGFTFVLKTPQRITHIARLKGIDDSLRYFTETVRPLGAKLGPILVQLPPNFKQDLARLQDFLTLFPADLRCAFEFRHATWFSDGTYAALRAANAALCIADTEDGHTPLQATADFGYFRLRDEGYQAADLETWVGRLNEMGASWGDAFVFFKHEESGEGPRLAAQFAALFGELPRGSEV